MTKRALLLSIALFLTVAISAKVYIPLVKNVPTGTNSGGGARTSSPADITPVAYYETFILYIEYPDPLKDVSRVIIKSSSGTTMLNSNVKRESTSAQIYMGNLMAGSSYSLSIYSDGNTWVGNFTFEPTSGHAGFNAFKVEPGKERNFCFFGAAGNALSGWNYGVCGVVQGNNAGTGIYGSSILDEGFNTGERYAGLFHGNIKITDAVYASAYNTLADSRLNKDMELLGQGTLDNMLQLSVFKYSMEQFDVENGDESTSLGYYNNDSGILDKKHFGLSAQEIGETYPDLVFENKDGYLSINYVEMIPLLIQSIQELKAELDKTNAQLDALKSSTNVSGRIADNTAVLYQNTPNPFSERCVVRCSIPQDINDALFCIYDYNGRQIQSRSISERGDVRIVVHGNSLIAGIYLYSLIIDGNLVDTKRMVKTE